MNKISNIASNSLIIYAVIYLVVGNIARVLPITTFTNNNLLVTELLLYVFTLSYLVLFRFDFLGKFLLDYYIIFTILIVSFAYGTLLNGFMIIPLLYNIRLIFLIFCATIVGTLLHEKFKSNFEVFFDHIIVVYSIIAIISYIIFFLFPDTTMLWNYLRGFGIEFNGDPHQRRLISVYFDPNFYSSIVAFPTVLSLIYLFKSKSLKYILLFLILICSVILSQSRNGIATQCFLVFALVFTSIIRLKSSKGKLKIQLHNRNLIGSILFIFALLIFFLIAINIDSFREVFERIVERFITIDSDSSAYARLKSAVLGVQLFNENPLFGIGYDYLSVKAQELRNLSSLDSSLLTTLVNFGILFTTLIALVILNWHHKIYRTIARHNFGDKNFLAQAYTIYTFYVFIVIVFTCQFINILYYQFWLFPTVLYGTYFAKISKDIQAKKEKLF